MNPDRRRFSALGLGTLGAGLGLAGCSTLSGNAVTSPPPADPGRLNRAAEPALVRGQAWEFRSVNLYNKEATGNVVNRIARTDDKGLVVELIGEKSAFEERYARPWQIQQEAHHDATLRYEQAINLIPAQLTPGYREQQTTRYVVVPTRRESLADAALANAAEQSIVFRDLFWNQYLEVTGWERLTVPAGSFDVARISRRIYFKHFDVFRTESVRTETLWYAPEIGYWVAREWTGQYRTAGGRRRGDFFREDWVRWELLRKMGSAVS